MKPDIAFRQRLARFISSRKIKYADAVKQIGVDVITPTGLSRYCDMNYVNKCEYMQDSKIFRIKEWMKGIQLMEQSEATRSLATEVPKLPPPPKVLDRNFAAADSYRSAKIVHALMASPYLTQDEKEQLTSQYIK